MDYVFREKHKLILKDILEGDNDIVLLDSSIRSGKSFLCTFATVLYAMEKAPTGSMFAIMGYSMTSISQNIDKYLRSVCDDLGITIKKSIIKGCLRLTNTNGHYVDLVYFSAKDVTSFKGIQGKTIHNSILFMDEATLFNEEAFNQARARVTGKSKIVITCNPDRSNHWIKERFIDNPKDNKISRYHLYMDDNPSLTKEDIDKFKSFYTGTFYRRYILGEWCTSDNLVFPMFGNDNIKEPRGKRVGKTIIGSDFGSTDPTTAVKVIITDNRILVTDEFGYKSDPEQNIPDLSPEQLASKIKSWLYAKGSSACTVFFDPAAKHWGLSLKNKGLKVSQANNTLLSNKNADGKIIGITLLQSLFTSGKIEISPACDNLIQELYNWQWDNNKANTPEKGNDHYIDALRYVLNSNYTLANKILNQTK